MFDLTKPVTQFVLDAEVDAFGTKRIVDSINDMAAHKEILEDTL